MLKGLRYLESTLCGSARNLSGNRGWWHARSDEGSNIVEFALSCSILFVLLFGIIEMSMALYTYTFVASAAREATRYAVVRGSQCTGFPECTTAAPATHGAVQSDIQNYVHNLGFPYSNQMTVTASWPSTTNCTPVASPCNNQGNLVKVVVTCPFTLSIPFWRQATVTLASTSEMVISR
jgi:Flp pilus assembly protein TadG